MRTTYLRVDVKFLEDFVHGSVQQHIYPYEEDLLEETSDLRLWNYLIRGEREVTRIPRTQV